ncbi:hypothetical protein V8F20_003953 [Naviculisporaceae sp. PSN 640]
MADHSDTGDNSSSAASQGEADSLALLREQFRLRFGGDDGDATLPEPNASAYSTALPRDGNGTRTTGTSDAESQPPSDAATNSPERPQAPTYNVDVHFSDDLAAQNLILFCTLLENCIRGVRESVAAWREITGPIAWELWDVPLRKQEDDPLFQAARQVDGMMSHVSGMGDEVGDKLHCLLHKVRPPQVATWIQAGDTRDLPPVDLSAWICLFWFWGCWRKECKNWIDRFQKILHEWDSWAWTSSLHRSEALLFIGRLVKTSAQLNPPLNEEEWTRAFSQSNPFAFEWFGASENRGD